MTLSGGGGGDIKHLFSVTLYYISPSPSPSTSPDNSISREHFSAFSHQMHERELKSAPLKQDCSAQMCARLVQLVRSLTANQEFPGSIPGLVKG